MKNCVAGLTVFRFASSQDIGWCGVVFEGCRQFLIYGASHFLGPYYRIAITRANPQHAKVHAYIGNYYMILHQRSAHGVAMVPKLELSLMRWTGICDNSNGSDFSWILNACWCYIASVYRTVIVSRLLLKKKSNLQKLTWQFSRWILH